MEEHILIVDEDNNIIGTCPRNEAIKSRYWYRSSYVFVYNSQKKAFVVQQRSDQKSYCPGYFSLANGGLRSAEDKDDLDNAQREVSEEIGIPLDKMQSGEVNLHFIGTWKYPLGETAFCNVYAVKYDGEVKAKEPELKCIDFWSIESIAKNIAEKRIPITPDTIFCYEKLMASDTALAVFFDPDYEKEQK